MSTILLYRRFGIFGYNFVKQDFIKDLTFFRIEQPRERLHCPLCNSSDVWAQGGEVRTIRKPTFCFAALAVSIAAAAPAPSISTTRSFDHVFNTAAKKSFPASSTTFPPDATAPDRSFGTASPPSGTNACPLPPRICPVHEGRPRSSVASDLVGR